MGGAEDYAGRAPVTADVQRELAEALATIYGDVIEEADNERAAAALLPTVQALIADAGQRAAAKALETFAQTAYAEFVAGRSDEGNEWARVARAQAAALDPAGADSGEGR